MIIRLFDEKLFINKNDYPMLDLIFENEFTKIFVDTENAIYQHSWKGNNRFLTPEEYQGEITRQGDHILQYKPSLMLLNLSEFEFIISPDLQNFVNTTLLDRMSEIGLKKLAIVEGRDFVSALSAKQTFEEHENRTYNIQYFKEEAAAQQWLIKEEIAKV